MKLLSFEITPLSDFGSFPKGDMLFSQMLAQSFWQRENTFANYLGEKPKLIVSDMMPLGYFYKPTLPFSYFDKLSKKERKKSLDRKEFKKKAFIKYDDLESGELYKCKEINFYKKITQGKNSINRLTFTTSEGDFAPYKEEQISFCSKLWIFLLVDKSIELKAIELLKNVGKFGFGKNSSTGKGQFELKPIKNPFKLKSSDYFMSISPMILNQDENIKSCFYEPFTKFGKFHMANESKNTFKKPLLLAKSSAVLEQIKGTNSFYYGSSIDNSSVQDKKSFVQGFSIKIPITIKEKQWLNTK
ncbi:CRISPR-associated protein Csm4 [Malaciobacter marinus]|jgi:CRISPR-associated protein Csm4|uniref:CRISPR system Cms protein Csm4 n=1 Tax=Malaciobacter marinus TaxID=505249 RepID=A0AB36ZVJ1_9BACT|nr:hypothetical protein [Malaciobacter marinus]PPK60524.1 CRISPR-associated protein Csm4 [Malaciobacter marinus]